MTSDNHKTSEERKAFLDRLTNFLGNSEDLTTEEIKTELQEQGIDIDSMIINIKKLINETISEQKRQWMKEAPKIREKMRKQIEKSTNEVTADINTIKKRIKQLLEVGEYREQASVFFRNFEGMSDNDLKHLYRDYVNLIKLQGSDSNDD